MGEEESLEKKVKKLTRLWAEGKDMNINPFKQFKQITAIIDYLKENEYIELKFPTNKYMAYYELTDKGKAWALSED